MKGLDAAALMPSTQPTMLVVGRSPADMIEAVSRPVAWLQGVNWSIRCSRAHLSSSTGSKRI